MYERTHCYAGRIWKNDFFDTCVWIELLGVRKPVKPHEVRQSRAASDLLNRAISEEETIITCKEQMLELIQAIEKVAMRTVNRTRKQNQQSGVSALKEFRTLQEFQATKELCETVIDDVRRFAIVKDIGEYNISSILKLLELADINDCLYYDLCVGENVRIYTFDSDMARLGESEVLHRFDREKELWD